MCYYFGLVSHDGVLDVVDGLGVHEQLGLFDSCYHELIDAQFLLLVVDIRLEHEQI